jgi:HD-GYP domain-containing protein (c-di-GMP phosphodiesterase class II)
MLRQGNSPVLTMAANIALHHHEAYDGSGYPQGLAGDAIPVEARIVAVVNMIDAALDDPRRRGTGVGAVLGAMSGRTLDAACVDAWSCCTGAAAITGGRVACEP